MLCRKACSPIRLQGNTWSTCLAASTLPWLRQAWHSGWIDSCLCLMLFQAGVLYLLSDSLMVYCFPPCSTQKLLSLLLCSLHPRCPHLVLNGAYGIRPSALAYRLLSGLGPPFHRRCSVAPYPGEILLPCGIAPPLLGRL